MEIFQPPELAQSTIISWSVTAVWGGVQHYCSLPLVCYYDDTSVRQSFIWQIYSVFAMWLIPTCRCICENCCCTVGAADSKQQMHRSKDFMIFKTFNTSFDILLTIRCSLQKFRLVDRLSAVLQCCRRVWLLHQQWRQDFKIICPTCEDRTEEVRTLLPSISPGLTLQWLQCGWRQCLPASSLPPDLCSAAAVQTADTLQQAAQVARPAWRGHHTHHSYTACWAHPARQCSQHCSCSYSIASKPTFFLLIVDQLCNDQ